MAKTQRLPKEEREQVQRDIYKRLNIATDFVPHEGEARTSSFSDQPAAWRRGNRYYSEEEYQRTNARRQKLQNRADRLVAEEIARREGRDQEQEAETA